MKCSSVKYLSCSVWRSIPHSTGYSNFLPQFFSISTAYVDGGEGAIDLANKVSNLKCENFEYLYDNYNSVMNLFKSGVIKTEVLKRFLKRLNTVIELCEDELDFIYYVLYFFNYYKIYGDEYIDLSKKSDIHIEN